MFAGWCWTQKAHGAAVGTHRSAVGFPELLPPSQEHEPKVERWELNVESSPNQTDTNLIAANLQPSGIHTS